MKAKHIVIRVILLVLISLLSLALTAVGVFAVLGWNMHSEAIEARPVRQVYADASADEHFVSCDELPEFYVNAVTATEDRDFWGHSGIDPSAIVRALLHDIAAMDFAEGGSTITMQTAKTSTTRRISASSARRRRYSRRSSWRISSGRSRYSSCTSTRSTSEAIITGSMRLPWGITESRRRS